VLTGAEAVRAVARRHYDAILMDCQMPEMNGYEATAAIRAREGEGQHTPIIALTAGARSRDRERCLEAGMDDYLAKPVTKDALLSLVARYLRSGAQEARASLDEDTVSALEALDHDAMANVVSLYFDEAAKQMSNLSSAIDRGEPLAISQAAHRLKGSSGTLGAATVLQIATELEESADQGDLTNAESLFARLDVGLEETRDAFCSRMEAGPGS
jgi:CheY-like chemotaxis protein